MATTSVSPGSRDASSASNLGLSTVVAADHVLAVTGLGEILPVALVIAVLERLHGEAGADVVVALVMVDEVLVVVHLVQERAASEVGIVHHGGDGLLAVLGQVDDVLRLLGPDESSHADSPNLEAFGERLAEPCEAIAELLVGERPEAVLLELLVEEPLGSVDDLDIGLGIELDVGG